MCKSRLCLMFVSASASSPAACPSVHFRLKLQPDFLSVFGSLLLLLTLAASAGAQTAHFSYARRALASNGDAAVARISTGAVDFGTVAIGRTSEPIRLTFTFDSGGSIGRPVTLTRGASGLDFAVAATGTGTGTCTAGTSYSAGDTCTVDVIFTPRLAGTRHGAATLTDGSGKVLATAYLAASGSGAMVSFPPGVQSTLPISGLTYPHGIAVDGSGNVYIAVPGNNEVLKETLSGGSYTQSTIGSGLSGPSGVAVDGAGNVYIADSQNSQVLKETPSGSGYTQSTIGYGMESPYAVAVDGSGNVYIADPGNSQVLMETLSAGSYTQSTIASGWNTPGGVAVDASGNVYVVDTGNDQVLMETPSGGGYTQSTIGSDMYEPTGIAVDGFGNVYISDSGDNRVLKEALSGGNYTQSTIGSGFDYPMGVAVDGRGNAYISDEVNNRVLEEDFADPPSLSFAPTDVGSTSSDSPRTVTVANVGNAALIFPIPSSGNNPSIAPGFTLNSSGASACPLVNACSSAPGALAAGASCQLPISFSPVTAGTLSGSLVMTDIATQNIGLAGTGLSASLTITSLSPSSADAGGTSFALTVNGTNFPTSATVNWGGTALTTTFIGSGQITATVPASLIATVGTASVTVTAAGSTSTAATFTINPAAQTITFPNPGTQSYGVAPIKLTATASSGLEVSYAVISGPAAVSGSGSTLTITGAGLIKVQATQTGNSNYTAANPVTMSFTVSQAALTVTANDTSKVYGAVNPEFTDTITGFVNGDTSAVVTGTATLTTTATAAAGVGTYAITAAAGTLTASNYMFAFVPGTLTVSKAVLKVTASNASRLYGALNPEFGDTISGFVNGDTVAVVSGTASLTTTATAASAAGSYPITAASGTLAAINYTFTFANGALTVGAAPLTVAVNSASRTYGASNPTFSGTIAGLLNGDTVTAAYNSTATASSAVGSYAITATISGAAASNYTLTITPGTLTVGKAALTVTASNASRLYGAVEPCVQRHDHRSCERRYCRGCHGRGFIDDASDGGVGCWQLCDYRGSRHSGGQQLLVHVCSWHADG